jgi:hypothetical protein
MVFSFYDITESESLLKYNTKPQVIAVIAIPNTFKIRLAPWEFAFEAESNGFKGKRLPIFKGFRGP